MSVIKGKKASREVVRKIIRLHERGMGTGEIARKVGCTDRTVRRWILREGVERWQRLPAAQLLNHPEGEKIISAYQAGESVSSIVESIDHISFGKVNRLLSLAGVEKKPVGYYRRIMSEEEVAEAVSLYPQLSCEDIGDRLGFDRCVISAALKREGVKVLARGGHTHRARLFKR